jgi:hypothetical protein
MSQQNDHRDDETLLIALEQLGKGLDMLQGLFNRIEAYVTAPEADGPHSTYPRLTAEIPLDRTVH